MPRRSGILFAMVLVLAAFGIPWLVRLSTDWLWFGEVGYQPVFLRIWTARILVGTAVAATALGFFLPNASLALRHARRRQLVMMTPEGPSSVDLDPRRIQRVLRIGALVGALLAGVRASAAWQMWVLFASAAPFGVADPILGYDAGFYVFALPVYGWLVTGALTLVWVTAAAAVAAHVFSGRIRQDPRRGVHVDPIALRHLSVLAAVLFLLLGARAWLAIATLLTTPAGIIQGAAYADVHARMPMLKALVVAALAGAVLAAAQTLSSRRWLLPTAAALYAAVAFAGLGYPAAIQRLVVAPNEQQLETPYIVRNIEWTRRAFALDRVSERQLSGDALLSRADIDRNAGTFRNVPLWDRQPLLDTFGQIQEIRTYYDFASVHNDRYLIDGEWRQIMLSARELNSRSLPNPSWINEHLTFTHGYGLTLGPVNQVTREGLPVLFIKDLPPQSSVDLAITQPSIYYGELSNQYVIVGTRTKEFHYPKGDDNVYATYDGEGGVPLTGFLRKLLFAVRFASAKIVLSDDLGPASKILFVRRVPDRVRKIAPFLTFEPEPYLAIADGRLHWVQDAYTTSARYPYATSATPGVSYIRNSIKVTVDAYDGRTRFYLIDTEDPIAATIQAAFPGLLRPLAEMPEGLRTRLRYPQGIFQMQAAMYSTYHMTNPAVFYNKEDQWEVPALESIGGETARMQPWYTMMRLPGEAQAEFIQMLPFTPRQKDNLAAWMVAQSDGDSYGHLGVIQFPKQKVIFGPRQVEARIKQDQEISPQITLWNQQGSEVIPGNLLVIPIEESLVYIRPLYLRAAGGKIPELKRVIVAYQNRIVMAETLERALARVFPVDGEPAGADGEPATVAVGAPPSVSSPAPAVTPPAAGASPGGSLAVEARAAYDRAIEAQRRGDWARYGEELERLGELLKRMSEGEQAAPAPLP